MTEFHDPAFITSANWAAISNLLATLWMILGSALGIGGSMLLAHGMIPSLVNTRDLPPDLASKARLPLYGLAVVFFAMALVSIFLFISRLDAVTVIYYRGAQ